MATDDSVARKYVGSNNNIVKYDPMWTTFWHRFSNYPVDTSNRMFFPRALLDHTPILTPELWRLPPSSETVQFSFITEQGSELSKCKRILDYYLLLRRRTQIFVPDIWNDGSFVAFIRAQIIHPIMCLINGLRFEEWIPKISCTTEVCGDDADCSSIVCIQITMEQSSGSDYRRQREYLPRIIFYPPGLLWDKNSDSLHTQCDLPLPRLVNSQLRDTTRLLITDFAHVFKVTKMDTSSHILHGEMMSVDENQTTLRYIITSCIMTVLPDGHADLDPEIVSHVPYGCPNDPSLPGLSDTEVFAMCKRHIDFDRYTLSCSLSAVQQFLRWKERMRARPTIPMEGVTLSAKSGAYSAWRRPLTPRYALETLPDITTFHLRATQRTTYPDFVDALQKSVHFTIMLEQELSPASGTKFARTFVCQMLQIDSKAVMVPYPSKLCVKLYDDSIGKVEDLLPGDTGQSWLRNFCTDMEMLQNEDDVYTRLRHAWGSTLPFYYGAHQFTCSDNQQRYGILLELVPKITKPLHSCSESSQIAFIESARHAVRVLQYADVTQYDWTHSLDQIIVTPLGDGSSADNTDQVLSCTLVDFGLAKQGNIFYDVEREDDYAGMAWAITMRNGSRDGVPPTLMKHYGPREYWDFLAYTLPF